MQITTFNKMSSKTTLIKKTKQIKCKPNSAVMMEEKMQNKKVVSQQAILTNFKS